MSKLAALVDKDKKLIGDLFPEEYIWDDERKAVINGANAMTSPRWGSVVSMELMDEEEAYKWGELHDTAQKDEMVIPERWVNKGKMVDVKPAKAVGEPT